MANIHLRCEAKSDSERDRCTAIYPLFHFIYGWFPLTMLRFPLHKTAWTMFVLLLSPAVLANTPPGADALGNQLRQQHDSQTAPLSAPALVLPAETEQSASNGADSDTVVISDVRFTGLEGTGVTQEQARAAIAGMLHKPQGFSGLRQMAQRVTALLQRHGMLLAEAQLPPQTIDDGVLSIHIVPGRYDSAVLNNSSHLRSSVAERLVRTTVATGDIIRRQQLERLALLLGEIPGVDAGISLQAGTQAGTSQPDITLKSTERFAGYLGLDNQGDRTSGRQRVISGVYASELLGSGDHLRVDLLDAWQKSSLFSGTVDYSTLLGGYGSRGGVYYSHLRYRYALQGVGFNGYSDNWGAYLTHPWIRTVQARVDLRAEGAQQFLTDNYPLVFATLTGDGSSGRKQVNSGSVTLRGSVASTPAGITGFSLRSRLGNVQYRSKTAQEFARSGSGGQFFLLNYQLTHEQEINRLLSLYGALNGQLSNHNLDTSQKFLSGGPFAVRAYDVGSGSADQGNVATVELRTRWPLASGWLMGKAPQLSVAAFYDYARARQYKTNFDPSGRTLAERNNDFSLAGTGIYASLADAGSYALTLTLAYRTGDADPVSGRDERQHIWISAVKTF